MLDDLLQMGHEMAGNHMNVVVFIRPLAIHVIVAIVSM
jgi:hypothetical protein